jgi:hypothetical protein
MWHLVVDYGGQRGVDPNCSWQLPQSLAYIGSNPRETHRNKLGIRPHHDPKEKSVNEINEIRNGG